MTNWIRLNKSTILSKAFQELLQTRLIQLYNAFSIQIADWF